MIRRLLTSEEEHQQAVKLIMDSYYKLNPFWKRLPPHPSDFHANIMYRVKRGAKHGMAVGYYVDGQLAVVTITCPIEEYLSSVYPPATQSELFGLMSPLFAELDQQVVAALNPNRKTSMFDIIAVDSAFSKGGIVAIAYLMLLKGQLQRGTQEAFVRTSHPVTFFGAGQTGFRVIKKIAIQEGKFKGLELSMLHNPDLAHAIPPNL